MAFISAGSIDKGLLIGPEHGARTIFRERARYPAGFFVGLHTHRGDESFEVKEGRARFTGGREQRDCGPGEIIFVPAGLEHGFLALTDVCIEIFSQQRMGLYVVVLGPDGTRRMEEVFMEGFPSSNVPPDGRWTDRETIRTLYATTRHLL